MQAAGATRVHSAVAGAHVALPPAPAAALGDTPPEVVWHAVGDWDGARHGGAAEIAELAGRVRAAL